MRRIIESPDSKKIILFRTYRARPSGSDSHGDLLLAKTCAHRLELMTQLGSLSEQTNE
ncbi:MAG: hypothetical protein GXP27_02530 [Planctomycetes bacterium]|nr:hypothetical protein [Planctomycetota bacterium]